MNSYLRRDTLASPGGTVFEGLQQTDAPDALRRRAVAAVLSVATIGALSLLGGMLTVVVHTTARPKTEEALAVLVELADAPLPDLPPTAPPPPAPSPQPTVALATGGSSPHVSAEGPTTENAPPVALPAAVETERATQTTWRSTLSITAGRVGSQWRSAADAVAEQAAAPEKSEDAADAELVVASRSIPRYPAKLQLLYPTETRCPALVHIDERGVPTAVEMADTSCPEALVDLTKEALLAWRWVAPGRAEVADVTFVFDAKGPKFIPSKYARKR